jgi:probable HAF family extracellular repeat protein
VWNQTTGMTGLGTLGGGSSYATAINNQGQVTGNSSVASGYAHAFLYSNGSLMDLGTLGGGSSYGYGINGAGTVVGYSWLANSSTTHAFLYVNGVMLDLNEMIPFTSGWVLEEAYGINGAGQIVGMGSMGGVEHAFRLDPTGETGSGGVTGPLTLADGIPMVHNPEPGTIWLFALGALGVAIRYVRVRRSK